MTDSSAPKPALSSEHRQMLKHLREVNVDSQRTFAGIQAKIAIGILLLGVVNCFVFKDNWLPGLSYAVLIGTVFMIMSRARHDFCDLTGLIQALATKQDSDTSSE